MALTKASARFRLRQRAEPGQAVNVGLMLGDLECRQVLHDRVGAGKAVGNVLALGDAARVERDVGEELRIGLLEEAGYPHGKRIDRAKVHRRVVIRDELERLRQRQIAVRAAEGKEEIDRECQGQPPQFVFL